MNLSPPQEGRGYRRHAMILAVLALLIALAGGVAFLIFFWEKRGTAALGVSLALALACLGFGLIIWAHGLMPREEVSGERDLLPSSEEERKAFRDDFVQGENKIARRQVLGWMAGGTVGLLAVGSVSLLRSMTRSPLPVLFQPAWRKDMIVVTAGGKPVSTDLQDGDIVTVFPEGHAGSTASQTILMRVDEKSLRLPPGREGWTPQGFIAFSKICTHAGCPVAQYEKNINLLLCPCHQSTFDVLTGAQPVGGPAGRPLPQLPLYIDSRGLLRAQGNFSSAPGPGFWSEL